MPTADYMRTWRANRGDAASDEARRRERIRQRTMRAAWAWVQQHRPLVAAELAEQAEAVEHG